MVVQVYCLPPPDRLASSPTAPCLVAAERRLLNAWVEEARRAGKRPHQIVSWVHKKTGGAFAVWRHRQDGSLGCSVPCVICCKELNKFGLKVYCVQRDGSWFGGKLDEPDAPRSQPTSGQRMQHSFVGAAS